jgi:hypothetical protein
MSSIPFEWLSDNQKRAVEARLRFNEDQELARFPMTWIGKDRRGYGLVKTRFQISTGLGGREAGWQIDNVPIADYGGFSTVTTYRSVLTSFPLINPAHVIGSTDPEPFEQATLTAVTGDRQVGSSLGQLAILLGCYVVHISSGAAVFQPAATTVNIRVISTVAATGGAFTTEGTVAVNTAANFVDQIPLAATTGRSVSITGSVLTNIVALFNGDTLFSELVLGATAVGALLAVVAEIV